MTKSEAQRILYTDDPNVSAAKKQEANRVFYGEKKEAKNTTYYGSESEKKKTPEAEKQNKTIFTKQTKKPAWTPPGDSSTGIPIPSTPATNTGNMTDLAREDRLAAVAWQQGLDQDARDAQNRYQNLEGHFLDQGTSGPGGYGDILGGQGGFSPGEQSDIVQRDLLLNSMATPQQLNAQNLTPQEQAASVGSPYAARDISVGQLNQLRNMQEQGEARSREAVGGLSTDLRNAVNPDDLRVAEGYYPETQRLISNAGEGYEGIIDPNFLALRPEFSASTTGSLGNLARGYSEAIDPRFLSLSREFQQNYNYTPEDAQASIDLAGREVGMRTQAEEDALMRNAASAGNTDPLALQAARSRNSISGKIAAQAAMTDARSRARGELRSTSLGRENMRLGSEQDLANMAVRGYEGLTDRELNQANVTENMRLGAEAGIADRSLNAWDLQTQRAIDEWRNFENMRRGANLDVSDRLRSVGSEIGQTRLANERDLAQSQQQLGQYRTGTLVDTTRAGESESAARNYDLARNRQDIGYANMDTRYGQAAPASAALSSRYGSVYGQKKAEEGEGRGFLVGQQDRAQSGAQTTRQQRLQAGATGQQSRAQGTSSTIAAHYAPGVAERLAAAGLGAAGSYFGAR